MIRLTLYRTDFIEGLLSLRTVCTVSTQRTKRESLYEWRKKLSQLCVDSRWADSHVFTPLRTGSSSLKDTAITEILTFFTENGKMSRTFLWIISKSCSFLKKKSHTHTHQNLPFLSFKGELWVEIWVLFCGQFLHPLCLDTFLSSISTAWNPGHRFPNCGMVIF